MLIAFNGMMMVSIHSTLKLVDFVTREGSHFAHAMTSFVKRHSWVSIGKAKRWQSYRQFYYTDDTPKQNKSQLGCSHFIQDPKSKPKCWKGSWTSFDHDPYYKGCQCRFFAYDLVVDDAMDQSVKNCDIR